MSRKGGYFQKLSKGSENSDMTSKGLGEMFEGDSADMYAGNFRSRRWGAELRVSGEQTRERGPPSALAEISLVINLFDSMDDII